MSKNINQVYMANPITSNASTDLMYFGQSPYGAGNDAAMTYANFAAQFSGTTTGTAHQVLVNGTSATPQHGAITLTTPQNIDTTSDVQFNSVHAGSMKYGSTTISYAGGSTQKIVNFTTDGSDTNYLNISQSTLTVGVVLESVLEGGGSSALTLKSNDAAVVIDAAPIAAPGEAITFITNTSHFTTFNFPTTASTLRTVSFQDADGTVAYLTDVLSWHTIAGTSQAAAVNNAYVPTNVALTTITLPATAAVGAEVAVAGEGSGGWVLAANIGQTIKMAGTTTSSGGSLASSETYDAINVVCVVANTTWVVTNAITTGFVVS